LRLSLASAIFHSKQIRAIVDPQVQL